MRSGTILVLGATGSVGRKLCRALARAGRPVLAASRSSERADAVSRDHPGIEPVVVADEALEAPPGTRGVVVNCTGQEDTRRIKPWLDGGWDVVDISASSQYCLDLERLPDRSGSLLAGVGLMPGLSSLMATELALREPLAEQITISVLLGLADDHGPASSRWTLGRLGDTVHDPHGSFRNFSQPTSIEFPGGFGRRRAWRHDFADRALLPPRTGIDIITRYCFDSRLSGEATAIAARTPGGPEALLKAAPLTQRAPWGTDWWALVAEAADGNRLEALGRSQSQATADLTASAVEALLDAPARPGFRSLTEITSLTEVEPLLPTMGILLARSPSDEV